MLSADYEEHLLPGNRRLVVAFASGDQKRFEFGRTLSRLCLSHVLVRDSRRLWYQDGILELDRTALTGYLWAFVAQGLYVTTLGLSAGAYAALLYGQLARVDRVIAISPVTGAARDAFDQRWHHHFVRQPGDPDVLDLREVFDHTPIPAVRAFVSDGPDCELDRHMAERIGIRDVTLVPGFDHATLARGMRDNGMLEKAICGSI